MKQGTERQDGDGVSLGDVHKVLAFLTSRTGIIGIFLVVAGFTYWWTTTAAGALQTAGVGASKWTLAGLAATGLLLGVILVLSLRLWALSRRVREIAAGSRVDAGMRIVLRTDESVLLEMLAESAQVTILSSRSASFFTQFNRALRTVNRTTPLDLVILSRDDGTAERDVILRDQFSKWQGLAAAVPFRLNVSMYASPDWTMMFRGLIFDKREGLLGFYVHEKEFTYGTEQDYIRVSATASPAEQLMLKAAIAGADAIRTQSRVVASKH